MRSSARAERCPGRRDTDDDDDDDDVANVTDFATALECGSDASLTLTCMRMSTREDDEATASANSPHAA